MVVIPLILGFCEQEGNILVFLVVKVADLPIFSHL